MRPVCPLGNVSSARIARSTSGVRSLASRGADLGLLASEQPRHVHGVRADVHRGAAGEVVLVADVGELGEREAQRGLDAARSCRARRSRRSRACAARAGGSGSGTPPSRRARYASATAATVFGLRGVRGERLLARARACRLRARRSSTRRAARWAAGCRSRRSRDRRGARRSESCTRRDAVLRRERFGAAAVAGRDRADLGFAVVAGGLDDPPRQRCAPRRGCRSGRCSSGAA